MEEGVAAKEKDGDGGQERAINVKPEILEPFRPWMLVSRKSRKADRRRDFWGNKEEVHDFRGGKDSMHDIRGDNEGMKKFRSEPKKVTILSRELKG
ncbi:hypothetical protein DITRI_Ditri01bG0125600 [Diplodiscus trichospermus]